MTIEAEEFIGASKSGHGVIYMTDKRTANVTGGSFTCNTVTLLKDSARKKDVKLS